MVKLRVFRSSTKVQQQGRKFAGDGSQERFFRRCRTPMTIYSREGNRAYFGLSPSSSGWKCDEWREYHHSGGGI